MSGLVIDNLCASVNGRPILKGVNLSVGAGEIHAIMGPNGSGKSTLSHVLMGKPGYEVTAGSAVLDGVELLTLPPWQRARAGLFLAMQYPIEVPGVVVDDVLAEALAPAGRGRAEIHTQVRVEAARIGLDPALLDRALNEDLSGGEKKRNETLQLAVVRPRFAVLDEIDSGLDVDALRMVSRRIYEATREHGLGVLAITHYRRLFDELAPSRVHVLANGVIKTSGGPELADELERTGYAGWVDSEPAATDGGASRRGAELDPFADPFE